MNIEIVKREKWGAVPVTKPGHPVHMGPVSQVYIHHSVSADNGDEHAELRLIQRLHMDDDSSDIDYSWLIGRDADVYQGRGWGVEDGATGTGPGEEPDGSMGGVSYSICCLGNYDLKQPTTEMIDAIRQVISLGIEGGFITDKVFEPGAIRGHREVRATSCPGDHVFEQLDAIRVPWEEEGMPYLFNEDCRQGYAEGRNVIFASSDHRAKAIEVLSNPLSENNKTMRDNQIGRRFAAQDWLTEHVATQAIPKETTRETPREGSRGRTPPTE